MKKLLLILLCLPMIGFGQSWEKTFGDTDDNDWGTSVQQTNDGGYIITGATNVYNAPEMFICLYKTDGNGVHQWNKNIGSGFGRSVQQTTDGGYIIIGDDQAPLTDEEYISLIKTDGNGVEQWNNTFTEAGMDQNCSSVLQTTDGGYIIAGIKGTHSNITGNDTLSDVYLLKTDGNGVEQWNKTFGGIADDYGYSVQQTTDGGYIITGFTSSFGNGGGAYLIKTDGNGIEQWSKTFEGWGSSVQQTTDGGYIITGNHSFDWANLGFDAYLLKTDGNGVEQWSKTFGGAETDIANYVQQTTDGGYIITGWTYSFGNGMSDVYLIKTDSYGVELWSQTFGGASLDEGNCVQQTTDGGYIITGITRSLADSKDIYLIKTDGNGNITSTFNIPRNPNRKLENTVDILGKQTKPQINTPFIEIYDDGTVEKRIIIE
jgi:hypothetical protein